MDKSLEYYCQSVLGLGHLFKPSDLKDFGLEFGGDFLVESALIEDKPEFVESPDHSGELSQKEGCLEQSTGKEAILTDANVSTGFHFIGESKGLVLVIPWEDFSQFTNSEEFRLLKKIIGAMKLDLSSLLIALYSDFQSLMESEEMRELHQAIFFGRNDKIPFPSHELIHQSGKTLLVTTQLETMLEKPGTKKQVWVDLQALLKEINS